MDKTPKPDVKWLDHHGSSFSYIKLQNVAHANEFSTPHRSLLCSQGFFEDSTDRLAPRVEWLTPRCRRCTPPDQPIRTGCGSPLSKWGYVHHGFRVSSSYFMGGLTIWLCPSCNPGCTSKNGWFCYGSWNSMMASTPSDILDDHGPFLAIDVGWMVNQWEFPIANFKSMGIPNYKFQWFPNTK